MRKKIISPDRRESNSSDTQWLQLDDVADVELTSEDADYPIESALMPGKSSGWRAADPGEQTIRLLFAKPQQLRRIGLEFVETDIPRTQQFVLSWSADGGHSFREIVRQQWNFDPLGAISETEDFQVELPAVTVLELSIIPDISGGDATASLQQIRLA